METVIKEEGYLYIYGCSSKYVWRPGEAPPGYPLQVLPRCTHSNTHAIGVWAFRFYPWPSLLHVERFLFYYNCFLSGRYQNIFFSPTWQQPRQPRATIERCN
jgi:hypothetical protein